MPYYPDVAGAPQNSIIGGASLWVMGGKKRRGIQGRRQVLHLPVATPTARRGCTRQSGYLPITKAAYAEDQGVGLLQEEPDLETPLLELTNKAPTENSRGLRFGNLVQMRDVWAEEIEAALAGKKTAKAALDAAVAARQRRCCASSSGPRRANAIADGDRRAAGAIRDTIGRRGCTRMLGRDRVEDAASMEKRAIFAARLAALRAARAADRDHAHFLLSGRRPGGLAVVPARRTRSGSDASSSGSRTTRRCSPQPEYYQAMATTVVFSTLGRDASRSRMRAAARGPWPTRRSAGARAYKTLLIWPYAVAPGGRRRAVAVHVPPLARASWRAALRLRHRLEPAAQRRRTRWRWSSSPRPGSRSATISCSSSPGCRRSRARDRGGGDRRRRPDAALLDHRLPAALADRRSSCWSSTSSTSSSTPSASSTPSPAAARRRRPRRWSTRCSTTAARRRSRRLGGAVGDPDVIVIALTAIQFRYIERKVHYYGRWSRTARFGATLHSRYAACLAIGRRSSLAFPVYLAARRLDARRRADHQRAACRSCRATSCSRTTAARSCRRHRPTTRDAGRRR